MNLHIPKWLIFSTVGAFALFDVVTHAPDFLNAYGRYKAQQSENGAKSVRPNDVHQKSN
jgi:hypothetical protein